MNFIVSYSHKTQALLEKVLKIKFKNNIAETKELMLRKEIIKKIIGFQEGKAMKQRSMSN